jgi:serine/threonine-protein kinase
MASLRMPEGTRGRVLLALMAPVLPAAVALGVVLAAADSGKAVAHVGGADAEKHTITGTMTVWDSRAHYASKWDCSGEGGYDDIRYGTPVTVRDGTGRIIATGSLDGGKSVEPSGGACEFTFRVDGVPKVDFYQVEVSHRGALTYSFSDLETHGWSVTASLGS